MRGREERNRGRNKPAWVKIFLSMVIFIIIWWTEKSFLLMRPLESWEWKGISLVFGGSIFACWFACKLTNVIVNFLEHFDFFFLIIGELSLQESSFLFCKLIEIHLIQYTLLDCEDHKQTLNDRDKIQCNR